MKNTPNRYLRIKPKSRPDFCILCRHEHAPDVVPVCQDPEADHPRLVLDIMENRSVSLAPSLEMLSVSRTSIASSVLGPACEPGSRAPPRGFSNSITNPTVFRFPEPLSSSSQRPSRDISSQPIGLDVNQNQNQVMFGPLPPPKTFNLSDFQRTFSNCHDHSSRVINSQPTPHNQEQKSPPLLPCNRSDNIHVQPSVVAGNVDALQSACVTAINSGLTTVNLPIMRALEATAASLKSIEAALASKASSTSTFEYSLGPRDKSTFVNEDVWDEVVEQRNGSTPVMMSEFTSAMDSLTSEIRRLVKSQYQSKQNRRDESVSSTANSACKNCRKSFTPAHKDHKLCKACHAATMKKRKKN